MCSDILTRGHGYLFEFIVRQLAVRGDINRPTTSVDNQDTRIYLENGQ